MSTSTRQTTVPKVRTYAADLNSARAKNSTFTTTPPVTAAPVAAPVIITSKEDTLGEGVIPPFHSFEHPEKNSAPSPTTEHVVTRSVSQTETQKILSRSSNLSAESASKENLPAVIITDTKRKRFKLGEAIAASVSDWWTTKQEVARKNKIPRYTVPEAERRKGVIQKATVKTGRTSSADHGAVLSRIKATKQISHTAESLVPSASPKIPAISAWETAEPVVIKEIPSTPTPHVQPRHNPVPGALDHEHAPFITPPENWESDIQTKVNALTKPAPVSNIVITGQEFTKIKQQRLATLVTKPEIIEQPVAPMTPRFVPVVPKIVPRIPPIEIVAPKPAPTPARMTGTILPPPQVVPVAVPKPDIAFMPVPVAVTPTVPTPINRPKILPTIPEPLQSNVSPLPVPAAMPLVVEQPNIFQSSVMADDVRGDTTPLPQRRFAPPREEKRSFLASLTQTNHIVFIAFGIFIIVVVSGLGLRTYLNTSPSDSTTSPVAFEPTAFTDTTLRDTPVFITTATDITNILKEQMSVVDSLVEITVLNQSGSPLTPSDFLGVLGADVVFDFKSAVTVVAIGTYRGTPWVLFTVSDKNTALGGMLAWENNISQDLAPIFGTGRALSRNRFSDSIIGTTDVRVLKNNEGTEEITYGFTTYNTLLITGNTTAFLNLSGKIQ
jgi:hypothetical protein